MVITVSKYNDSTSLDLADSYNLPLQIPEKTTESPFTAVSSGPPLCRKPAPIRCLQSSPLPLQTSPKVWSPHVHEARKSSCTRSFFRENGERSFKNPRSRLLQQASVSWYAETNIRWIGYSLLPVQRFVERVEKDLCSSFIQQQTGPIVPSSQGRGSVPNDQESCGSWLFRIAFGKRFDENESERRRFDQLMIESQAMQAGFFVSDYLPWFSWVDKLSGILSRLDKTFRDMDEFYQELIDEHLDPSYKDKIGNPNNILDLLIQLKDQNLCSIDLTWDHIKAVLFDIFVAGTDTSAAVTVWAMTALIKNSDAMRKLRKEIREIIGEKGFVSEDDISKLPYLRAVIKETLRLYPPAPLLLPRQTLEQCFVQGYTIPPQTLVHINAWAISRDPQCWDNPTDFLPERFLIHPSIDVIGQDFELIPFGSGRRGCPGVSIGLATVDIALANLVYSFDWELPEGMSKEDVDTDVLPGITMHKKNPLAFCLEIVLVLKMT